MNTHSSVPSSSPTPFFWRQKMKYPKTWVGGEIFKKVCTGNQKEKAEKMQRSKGDGVFTFSIFSYDGNWHCF